jgi:nitroimidazol reductase NimA-like FMN-containing flavoprotein (pyridoxamine 5'-phosphate oxidase superfamily)
MSVGAATVWSMSQISAPQADRPVMPEGYGLPISTEGLLAWADVEARLVASTSYWLATVRPDGRPHVVPRWGVWLDGRFWYDGSPATVHARNLVVNPACSLNLENGTQAVIVEGESQLARAEAESLGARIAEAFAKYHDLGYRPRADAWAGDDGGGLRVLTPRRALAWFTFPTDATRFHFDAGAFTHVD